MSPAATTTATFSDRVYRRVGARIVDVVLAVTGLTVLVVIIPAYTSLLLPYFKASAQEWVEIVAVFELAFGVATPIGFLTARRGLRHVRAWASGDRGPESAAAAWAALVTGLPRVVFWLGAGSALVCIPPAMRVASIVDLSWSGTVLYAFFLLVLVVGCCMFTYLLMERGFGPVRAEAAAAMPAGTVAKGRTATISRKLLVFPPMISLFSGTIIAAVSTTENLGIEGRLGVTLASTVLFTVTVALGLSLLLRRSLLERLDELRRAIRSVDAGDLSVSVPNLNDDEIDEVGRSFNQMVAGLRERTALRGALDRYVSPDLADRVVRGGQVVEGEEVVVTVMFVDIRDFTWLVDRSGPQDTVAYLNEFFALIIPVIEEHGGHANKLLGDGLLAVFGAPVVQLDHAVRAVAAGAALVEATWERYGGELRIGVGVSSGPVVAGTVGGGRKLDYTIIGDTVNVAARVEQMTKDLQEPLLMTASTRELLPPETTVLPRGGHRLRGKSRETQLFTVPLPSTPSD